MVALGQFTLNETSQTNKGNFWILSSGKGKFYVGLPPLKGLKGTQRDSEGLRGAQRKGLGETIERG